MSPFLGGLTTFSGNVAGGVPQGSGSGGDSTATSGGFTRHTFTTVGDQNFTVTGTITGLEILIVGGGGGGGADNVGGGGLVVSYIMDLRLDLHRELIKQQMVLH